MSGESARYRLLVVDDAPAVREALRWALEAETDLVVVGEASNGREALNRAGELQPDAVILDVELPELDGYTVARRLKHLPNPPIIIFLTVHGGSASRQQAAEAGGDAFVEKGIGWIGLISQVRQLLADRGGKIS